MRTHPMTKRQMRRRMQRVEAALLRVNASLIEDLNRVELMLSETQALLDERTAERDRARVMVQSMIEGEQD